MKDITATEIDELRARPFKHSKEYGESEVKLTEPALDKLIKMMEEMANAPKEEMGKRQPGERCAYEIQRKIEND